MQYGVVIFPTEYTLQPADVAQLAEDRGFESVWFPEHTHIPVSRKTPWPGGPDMPREYVHTYDPFLALTSAAAATSRIKVGTGVTLIAQRDPIADRPRRHRSNLLRTASPCAGRSSALARAIT